MADVARELADAQSRAVQIDLATALVKSQRRLLRNHTLRVTSVWQIISTFAWGPNCDYHREYSRCALEWRVLQVSIDNNQLALVKSVRQIETRTLSNTSVLDLQVAINRSLVDALVETKSEHTNSSDASETD